MIIRDGKEITPTNYIVKDRSLKKLIDIRESAAYLFSGYLGQSVDGIIEYNDTENAKSVANMFENCLQITHIPSLNLASTENFMNMFYNCINLTSLPNSLEDITPMNCRMMFAYCNQLTEIPLFNTSQCSSLDGLFAGCWNITTIPQFNTSNVTSMATIFSDCGSLTNIPLLDTNNLQNASNMFNGCTNLTTIPALDFSNVGQVGYIFNRCSNLEEIHITGLRIGFDISASTKFTREALVEILTNLATITSSQTITMGATNLAKLTEDDITIATNKGWTVA